MSSEIKFGTDGWRAVIGDGFTFGNLRRVTQATCDVIRKNSKSRLVLVGYDRRFFSKEFAETAAKVFSANGFRIEIGEAPIGSPTLSYQVREKKAALGAMITASHNPPIYNGFKLKGIHGGSVPDEFVRSVESRLDVEVIRNGEIIGKQVDLTKTYLPKLRKLTPKLNISGIRAPIFFDAMHGPGGKLFESLFHQSKNIRIFREEVDPLFGGLNPEPIEINLSFLKEKVIQSKGAIGIAVDGDVDRIGVIDDKGCFLPPHIVMPLLILHLVEIRKLKGKVLQTVSMGYLSRRIAEHHKLPFEEVPVGFKHIAKKMMEENILIGGEESGGYGVGFWIPERDALLSSLLLLEMLSVRKCPLSELVSDLEKRFGSSHFKRVDFPCDEPKDKSQWTNHISSLLGTTLIGMPIKQTSLLDGVKIQLEDDSWILLRPSGTESLVRTYSESSTSQIVEELLKEGERLVKIPLPRPDKKDSANSKSKKKMKAFIRK